MVRFKKLALSAYEPYTLAVLVGGRSQGSGIGIATRFNNPGDVAGDSAGNVYVADSGNASVRKVSPSVEVITLAGQGELDVNRQPVYGSADGVGEAARFAYLSGVTVALTRLIFAMGLALIDIRADSCAVPSFRSQTSDIAGNASFVASTDLNGDGKLDLIVASNTTGSPYTNSGVSVLLGKGDGSFQTPAIYNCGTNPVWIAVGDFNGDGKSDLVVANQGACNAVCDSYLNGSLSVLLGRGDGTFQAPLSYDVGSGPNSIAVGDFNRDGKLDIAVCHSEPAPFGVGGVTILLGVGDGTFKAGAKLLDRTAPTAVAIGDLNADGKPDLVIGISGGGAASQGTAWVLIGNGDGSFQPPKGYGDAPATALTLGDFNGDGRLDLAVTTFTCCDPKPIGAFDPAGAVLFFLGKGDGTFQPATKPATILSPHSVNAGDVNGDGILDLIVGSRSFADNRGMSSAVTMLLGKGDGTFESVGLPVSATAMALAGDFNGDGKVDLACVDFSSPNVSLLLNQGMQGNPFPTLAQLGQFQADGYGGYGAIGDLNGDGQQDLVVGDIDSGNISVLLGNPDGSFATAITQKTGKYANQVVLGDFNSDGKTDVVTADYCDGGDIILLLGKGDGTLGDPVTVGGGSNPSGIAVGDFDDDGKPDIAVADFNGDLFVLFNSGNAAFKPAIHYPAALNPFRVAAPALTTSGKPDLIVIDGNAADAGNSAFSVLLNRGDGTFASAVRYVLPFPAQLFSLVAADLNGDGKLDVAIGGNDLSSFDRNTGFIRHFVATFLGTGDGSCKPADIFLVVDAATTLAVADFNGDGCVDLVAVGHGPAYGDGGMSLLMGNGDGTFQPALSMRGYSLTWAGITDLNHDQKPDLVTVNSEDLVGNAVTVWLNTTCQAGPNLLFTHHWPGLTLSWPYPSDGYTLESASNLTAAQWNAASLPAKTNQNVLQATASTTNRQGYFRLHKH